MLGEAEVRYAVGLIAWGMLLYAALVAVLGNLVAGCAYAGITGYLWLMYREFFLGEWLEARPLLYAATHQVIVVALVVFAALCADAEACQARREAA